MQEAWDRAPIEASRDEDNEPRVHQAAPSRALGICSLLHWLLIDPARSRVGEAPRKL